MERCVYVRCRNIEKEGKLIIRGNEIILSTGFPSPSFSEAAEVVLKYAVGGYRVRFTEPRLCRKERVRKIMRLLEALVRGWRKVDCIYVDVIEEAVKSFGGSLIFSIWDGGYLWSAEAVNGVQFIVYAKSVVDGEEAAVAYRRGKECIGSGDVERVAMKLLEYCAKY